MIELQPTGLPLQIFLLTFLSLTGLVSLGYITSVTRRIVLIREKFNTFHAMTLLLVLYFPLTLIYLGLAYDQSTSTRNYPPALLSFLHWWSFVPIGNTFGPLIAAWVRLSNKSATRQALTWSWDCSEVTFPLTVVSVLFALTTLVVSIMAGLDNYYTWALRVFLISCVLWILFCSAMLVYSRRKIHHLISELKPPDEGFRKPVLQRIPTHEAMQTDKDDVVLQVKRNLDRIVFWLVGFVFLPSSLGILAQTVALDYIDQMYWVQLLLMTLYRCTATSYCALWTYLNWVEASRKVVSSRGHGSGTSGTSQV